MSVYAQPYTEASVMSARMCSETLYRLVVSIGDREVQVDATKYGWEVDGDAPTPDLLEALSRVADRPLPAGRQPCHWYVAERDPGRYVLALAGAPDVYLEDQGTCGLYRDGVQVGEYDDLMVALQAAEQIVQL